MLLVNDKTVVKILKNADQREILRLQDVISDNLLRYTENHDLIPQRIVSTTECATHLFMPALGQNVGIKTLTGSCEGFKGVTMVLDKMTGDVTGIVNARSLTAFRTALSSLLVMRLLQPMLDAYSDESLAVIGSGPQSYWHVRLANLLYPNRFKRIIIVNRSPGNAERLKDELMLDFPEKSFELILHTEERRLATLVRSCSTIFGCVPTTQPIITDDVVSKERKVFISLIGSYKPHMKEADHHLIERVSRDGRIIVDSMQHALVEAGELQDLDESRCCEISFLTKGSSLVKSVQEQQTVITKIVGLSIMDVCMAAEVLHTAREKSIGLEIEDF